MGIKHCQEPQNELGFFVFFSLRLRFRPCTNTAPLFMLFFFFFLSSRVRLMLEVCNYGQIMGEADGIRKPLMGLSTQLPG